MKNARGYKLQQRNNQFTWQSKQELYDYFKAMYDIDSEKVDEEIALAKESFGIRKGQPIDPKELWQKVGNALEKKAGHSSPEYIMDPALISKKKK